MNKVFYVTFPGYGERYRLTSIRRTDTIRKMKQKGRGKRWADRI